MPITQAGDRATGDTHALAAYDVHGRRATMAFLLEQQAKGEIVTGLIHLARETGDLHADLETVDMPLNVLGEKELCPGVVSLQQINASLR